MKTNLTPLFPLRAYTSGVEVVELDAADSRAALRDHFGLMPLPQAFERTQPGPRLVLPAPSRVPEWDVLETEGARLRRRMNGERS